MKLESNGRLKIGYGGKASGRDHDNGGKDIRITSSLSSGVRRVEQRPAARPADAAGSDFYTSRFRRP